MADLPDAACPFDSNDVTGRHLLSVVCSVQQWLVSFDSWLLCSIFVYRLLSVVAILNVVASIVCISQVALHLEDVCSC